MKTIEDLKFGFECALGLDDREYSLEEVLEKVDDAFFNLHNLYAITWQKMRAYEIVHHHMKNKLNRYYINNTSGENNDIINTIQDYMSLTKQLLQGVQNIQAKKDFWKV